jgi:hypothetical protein
MNQDQKPVRADTPENDKAALAPGAQGANPSPPEINAARKPKPAGEAAATPPKV